MVYIYTSLFCLQKFVELFNLVFDQNEGRGWKFQHCHHKNSILERFHKVWFGINSSWTLTDLNQAEKWQVIHPLRKPSNVNNRQTINIFTVEKYFCRRFRKCRSQIYNKKILTDLGGGGGLYESSTRKIPISKQYF